MNINKSLLKSLISPETITQYPNFVDDYESSAKSECLPITPLEFYLNLNPWSFFSTFAIHPTQTCY